MARVKSPRENGGAGGGSSAEVQIGGLRFGVRARGQGSHRVRTPKCHRSIRAKPIPFQLPINKSLAELAPHRRCGGGSGGEAGVFQHTALGHRGHPVDEFYSAWGGCWRGGGGHGVAVHRESRQVLRRSPHSGSPSFLPCGLTAHPVRGCTIGRDFVEPPSPPQRVQVKSPGIIGQFKGRFATNRCRICWVF